VTVAQSEWAWDSIARHIGADCFQSHAQTSPDLSLLWGLSMPRDHRADFGTFIAIIREELKLNGTTLGAACGTTQAQYSHWERSKSLPANEQQVRTLAGLLQVDPERLVRIWQRAVRDTEKKGPIIVTRAYEVTSGKGGTTEDPY
jgi:hypothetical protein